jgi:hypothetical protein
MVPGVPRYQDKHVADVAEVSRNGVKLNKVITPFSTGWNMLKRAHIFVTPLLG